MPKNNPRCSGEYCTSEALFKLKFDSGCHHGFVCLRHKDLIADTTARKINNGVDNDWGRCATCHKKLGRFLGSSKI